MIESTETAKANAAADTITAKAKGLHIVGFARPCRCGGRAYHAPTVNWQNRVICLSCGKKWSA